MESSFAHYADDAYSISNEVFCTAACICNGDPNDYDSIGPTHLVGGFADFGVPKFQECSSELVEEVGAES